METSLEFDNWDVWLATLAVPFGLALTILSNILDRRRRRDFSPGLIPALPLLFLGIIIILLAAGYHAARFRGYR